MIDSGFQDVLRQAKKMLADSPLQELHLLGLERQGDSVTLSGRLSNYYLKQQAQETIRPATRGVYVRNLIRVESS
jgi:hypothetical protein